MGEKVKLPKKLVWAVVVLSVLPLVLKLVGVDFSAGGAPTDPEEAARLLLSNRPALLLSRQLSGTLLHTLLEWSAFSIAFFTAVFAFFHYSIGRDVTTPVIGTALFFSGMIDAFHILAADGLIGPGNAGLIGPGNAGLIGLGNAGLIGFGNAGLIGFGNAGLIGSVAGSDRFIPFTWVLSRTFNVCILIAGTAPFLWKARAETPRRASPVRYILLVGVLFGVMAYSIVHICAVSPLPQAVFGDAIVPRPWDCVPLVLYLFAGGVIFPRFHRMQPSLFSHGLIVSVIPHVAAQAHAAFGSRALFDADFNISHGLKIVAYLVPLAGLILDYVRAYQTEATLRATQEQLRVARDIQQGLFPQTPPKAAGFDLAGASTPAEAVGGDYFDYVPMQEGRLGVVVADVSGHELGAAILMAQTRAYLRALAQRDGDVGQIVTQLNRFLLQDVRDRMFVSLFFLRLDLTKGSFVYSAAGHEGHLLKASGITSTLESLSPLLGVLDEGTVCCGPETAFEPGDVLLLVTDGIIEAESRDGRQFGIERTLEIVSRNRDKTSREIVEILFQAVRKFRRRAPQKDDLTVVVLKRLVEVTTP